MRFASLAPSLVAVLVGCAGSNLEVAEIADDAAADAALETTTETSTDAGAEASPDASADGTPDGATPDTAPPPTCVAPTADSTDLWVDAAVATSGKGDAGCPFKTIVEASSFALTTGVKRTIHVKSGSYDEKDAVRLEVGVALVSEGGRSKLTGGATAPCAPSAERCVLSMKAASTLDGFDVDAKSVGIGVFGPGGAPTLRKSVIRNAQKDGGVFTSGAELGPEIHFDENGNAGAVVRGGRAHVIGSGNSFDANKGKGVWVGSTYVAGGGLLLYGAELDFEGGSASNNASGGVAWDWSVPGPSGAQKVTGLVAKGNQGGGLTVRPQSNLVLRKSTLTKNGSYGLWLAYNATQSNVFDLGTAVGGAPGGNVFRGAGEKNGKVGIFLCQSGKTASQPAEGDSFGTCPPSQALVANCDQFPSSYHDVGYVPAGAVGTTLGANPVVAATCTVGP